MDRSCSFDSWPVVGSLPLTLMPAVQSTMKKQKVKAMKVMKLAMKSTKSSDDDTKKGSDGKGGNTMKRPAGAPSKSTIADAVKEMQRGVG